MTKAEVVRLLGKPDDVRTAGFWYSCMRNGRQTTLPGDIWCYGTRGHLTFPSRGCVYMNREGTVQSVRGKRPVAPQVAAMNEADIDQLLRLMHQVPVPEGSTYNPLTVIKIVNALQPLGKDRALAVMEEYRRVAPVFDRAGEGMFVVLRVLFDVPRDPGFFPPPSELGEPRPKAPADRRLIPRFPVVLIEDVPLLMVSDYFKFGEAPHPEKEFGWFREHGRLRKGPLRPTDHPLDLLARIKVSRQWIFGGKVGSAEANTGKAMVMGQLLRLVKGVYWSWVDFRLYETRPGGGIDREWSRVLAGFRKIHVRWDARKDDYVRVK